LRLSDLNKETTYLLTYLLTYLIIQAIPIERCQSFSRRMPEAGGWDWGRPFIISFLPRCMECRRCLAMRILSVRPSVCPSFRPSVRLSVTGVDCDNTVERSLQIYVRYERKFSLVFEKKNGFGEATPSTW